MEREEGLGTNCIKFFRSSKTIMGKASRTDQCIPCIAIITNDGIN